MSVVPMFLNNVLQLLQYNVKVYTVTNQLLFLTLHPKKSTAKEAVPNISPVQGSRGGGNFGSAGEGSDAANKTETNVGCVRIKRTIQSYKLESVRTASPSRNKLTE